MEKVSRHDLLFQWRLSRLNAALTVGLAMRTLQRQWQTLHLSVSAQPVPLAVSDYATMKEFEQAAVPLQIPRSIGRELPIIH